jgi:NADH-quinone oxidoreductase subunit C
MVSDSITGPNPTMSTVPHESDGAYVELPGHAEHTFALLQARFPDASLQAHCFRDELTVTVPREQLIAICEYLKSDPKLRFVMLTDMVANDWPGREPRFEVNYQLLSLENESRLRLKVLVTEDEAVVPTVTSVWKTANWHEREIFDLFGIDFEGHPDLRRILLPEEWEGHPLRNDYEIGWEEPEFSVRKVQRDYAKG